MAEGIITLGIGSAPGNLLWFMTLGLGAGAVDVTEPRPLTLRARGVSLTLETRAATLTLGERT